MKFFLRYFFPIRGFLMKGKKFLNWKASVLNNAEVGAAIKFKLQGMREGLTNVRKCDTLKRLRKREISHKIKSWFFFK